MTAEMDFICYQPEPDGLGEKVFSVSTAEEAAEEYFQTYLNDRKLSEAHGALIKVRDDSGKRKAFVVDVRLQPVRRWSYEPFDGDFDPNRTDELIQFIDDLLGNFGIHRELCLSMEDDSTVRVLASNNEGSEWIWDKCYPIPGNWTVEQVADLFQYGNIYFEPDVKNKRLEVVKEAVEELLDDDFLSSEVALEALEQLEEVLREKIDELYAYIYAAERGK
jgi:hypothetical protein